MTHAFIRRAIELSERRNCIVHAEGKASRYYISRCIERGVDLGNLKEGHDLRPDKDYSESAFETSIIFCVMIFAAVWIKIFKKSDPIWEGLVERLNNTVYELMVGEKWVSAKSILQLIYDDLTINPAGMYERMLVVNRALCELETGNKDASKELLDSVDWRGTDLSFQAAVAALRGELDSAIDLIKKGYGAEQINKEDLIDWPVFNRIRKTKKFRQACAELFGEEVMDKVFIQRADSASFGPAMQKALRGLFDQLDEYRERESLKISEDSKAKNSGKPDGEGQPKAKAKRRNSSAQTGGSQKQV